MTTTDHQQGRRTQLASAAITGVLAGLTRAIIDALLHHLMADC